MEPEQRSLRIGAAAVVCAVILRLMSSGAFAPLGRVLAQPEVAAFLMYLETGRVIRVPPPEEPPAVMEETQPPTEAIPEISAPCFAAEDAASVSIRYRCDYRPDIEALLLKPMTLELIGDGPRVLILHTHTTESYTKTPGQRYEESPKYRTLDGGYNMLSIGDKVAQVLEDAGIAVIHDRELHDYPSYNGSYSDSQEAIQRYLAEYPTISMVLDLHRDAIEDSSGMRLSTKATVDGQSSAQLMLVMGTDAGGLQHPNWQENLSVAVKLYVLLERSWPGICRPISLRTQRFNQNESTGAMLIEVGAAGNTQQEALVAAEALAKAILDLAGIPR